MTAVAPLRHSCFHASVSTAAWNQHRLQRTAFSLQHRVDVPVAVRAASHCESAGSHSCTAPSSPQTSLHIHTQRHTHTHSIRSQVRMVVFMRVSSMSSCVLVDGKCKRTEDAEDRERLVRFALNTDRDANQNASHTALHNTNTNKQAARRMTDERHTVHSCHCKHSYKARQRGRYVASRTHQDLSVDHAGSEHFLELRRVLMALGRCALIVVIALEKHLDLFFRVCWRKCRESKSYLVVARMGVFRGCQLYAILFKCMHRIYHSQNIFIFK